MNNLKRYYNKNRKIIWRVIIIITSFILLLQMLNEFVKKSNEKKLEQIQMQIENRTNSTKNAQNEINQDLSEENTHDSTVNSKVSTIRKFVDYCNKQDLENAYSILTDNCKEEMFNNIDIFKNIYYDSTFENKQKEVTIENWTNNTYLVKFIENPLTTGKVAKTKEEQVIDYITVVKENDNYRLNINSFIGYRELSKTKKENGVTVEILGKRTYMDYETYTIRITNETERDVILDSLDNSNGIYIEDTNGIKYPMYNSELSNSMVTIASGHIKKLDIKFLSNYISTKKIYQLVFSNIIMNNSENIFTISL